MKKSLFLFCILCLVCIGANSRDRERGKLYSVAFYNLENLFDTIHDEGKNDYDFLPQGSYRWDSRKYESKLRNLAKVISQLSRERVSQGPAFIGEHGRSSNTGVPIWILWWP